MKVSVVMATYNGERFLKNQLDSILSQTYPIHEIIIQDDGSTDSTWEILKDYALKYQIVKVAQNSTNKGLNQNFISAFFKATGDYIAVSDQDDVWLPNRLEMYMAGFNNSDTTLVYADTFICNQNLEINYSKKFPHKLDIHKVVFLEAIPGHACIFKKDILNKITNWNDVDFTFDGVINLTALASGQVVHIDVPLTYHRRHEKNVTNLEYVPPAVQYKKPVALILFVLWGLTQKRKLKNFKWHFNTVYNILINFSKNNKILKLNRFIYFYKKESVSGMIISSVLYFIIRDDLPLMKRLKMCYYPFYKYYYYKRDGYGLRGD